MNKYQRCLWIVNELNDYGDASLKELNARWKRSTFCYDGEEIIARTFARDKEFIADVTQVNIEYNQRTRKYTLANPEVIGEKQLRFRTRPIMHPARGVNSR